MLKIMFVCTGNICRSSMAEEMMKSLLKEKALEDRVYIYSSGTAVDVPRPASENAIIALKEMDLDLTKHRSKLTTEELIDKADLVLAMTEGHKNFVLSIMPEAKDKVFTLIEYAKDGEKGDIMDPYLMNLETYQKCRDDILKHLKLLIKKLEVCNSENCNSQ